MILIKQYFALPALTVTSAWFLSRQAAAGVEDAP